MKSPRVLLLLIWGCVEDAPSRMVDLETADGFQFQIDVYEFPNRRDEMPTHAVSLDQARSQCESVGKRLCTSVEWRTACAGPTEARRYAYGDAYIPRICHTQVDLPSGHSSMLDEADLVATSGAYRECRTPEGVFDLIGNLEEWVQDDWRGIGGMLEGGAFYSHKEYADCTGNYSRQPDYRLVADQAVTSAGFRCCTSSEEPSSEMVSADTTRRIVEARAINSTADYASENEVEIAPGLYMDRYEYPNRAGEMPVRAITWADADARCSEAGKRLCSAAEWENACAGPERRALPYGDHYLPGACPVYLTGAVPSGSNPACESTDGLSDLVGGVWEWTSTPLDANSLRSRPDEVLREIRGGSWLVEDRKAVCRPDDGYPAAPEGLPFPDVGFRCCRGNPEVPERTGVQTTAECPPGLVWVEGTCIGRLEYPGIPEQVPEGGLDWEDANRACRDSSLRVCTETEWEAACEGDARRRWPYGDTYEPESCFIMSSHDSQQVNARPAGTLPDCTTPEGVMDMSGNLWEWTMDTEGNGVLRGGGWDFSAGLGQCRARADAEQNYAEAQLGVRCCADPLPIEATEAPNPSPGNPDEDPR